MHVSSCCRHEGPNICKAVLERCQGAGHTHSMYMSSLCSKACLTFITVAWTCRPLVVKHAGRCGQLQQHPTIFMRWKEQFFVNTKEECGLTIAGGCFEPQAIPEPPAGCPSISNHVALPRPQLALHFHPHMAMQVLLQAQVIVHLHAQH